MRHLGSCEGPESVGAATLCNMRCCIAGMYGQKCGAGTCYDAEKAEEDAVKSRKKAGLGCLFRVETQNFIDT